MAKKVWFYIRFKYEGGPWREYTRTQVSTIVPHYERLAMTENPGATIKTFKEV